MAMLASSKAALVPRRDGSDDDLKAIGKKRSSETRDGGSRTRACQRISRTVRGSVGPPRVTTARPCVFVSAIAPASTFTSNAMRACNVICWVYDGGL